MKVFLAGYNVDSTVLEELKRRGEPRDDVTPETLSAAYARISRDVRPVNELREIARTEVKKARMSNQAIIFKMGHHSVAEHAVFNFDILGLSRLAIEELQRFRLCSFTEKSQRYITLKDDFVLPKEIKDAGMEIVFTETIRAQNDLYHRLYKKLKPYMFDKNEHMAKDPKKHTILEGWAKEDARYVVSLATQGQLGMTVNARNLEYMIRRFASRELEEIRELNSHLHDLAKEVAPSIILFTESNDFDARTYEELEHVSVDLLGKELTADKGPVRLVDYTPDADVKLTAALLHSTSSRPFETCLKTARTMDPGQKKEFVKKAFQYMEFYDFVLREFEYIDLTFELVVSATCFAQLKRHRMATITTQAYDPALGVVIPPSVREVGISGEFQEIIARTEDAYGRLKASVKHGAEYVLTNAHQKRALLHVNARELYHISRLREDPTAQWDIREVSRKMSELAEEVMPLACLLIGGKNDYPFIYEKVFGRKPNMEPPPY